MLNNEACDFPDEGVVYCTSISLYRLPAWEATNTQGGFMSENPQEKENEYEFAFDCDKDDDVLRGLQWAGDIEE